MIVFLSRHGAGVKDAGPGCGSDLFLELEKVLVFLQVRSAK
jgi:hypothetical protein